MEIKNMDEPTPKIQKLSPEVKVAAKMLYLLGLNNEDLGNDENKLEREEMSNELLEMNVCSKKTLNRYDKMLPLQRTQEAISLMEKYKIALEKDIVKKKKVVKYLKDNE